MRLHWFSPLPPDRTDIGHYTARLLPALARCAQVTVWTATPEPDPRLSAHAAIRRLGRSPADRGELSRGDAILYNLGNHGPFHARILAEALAFPGIVVCHEADLHHLLAWYHVEFRRRPEDYVAALREAWGRDGERVARLRLAGADVGAELTRMPLLAPALRGCHGVVCHTEATFAAARALGHPALRLDLPYPAGPRRHRGKRTGPLRIVQFGHLGPNRRTLEILDAIARFSRQAELRFDILGELWDERPVRAKVEQHRLGGIVRLHGFVSEERLDQALAEADLVLNLRFPTIGEASGSQLRSWNAAVPSAVSDIGWFAGLPDDVVVKVPPGEEAERLHRLFALLLRDREALDGLGERGRALLEERHGPEAYARELVAACGEAGCLRRRAGCLAAMEALRASLQALPGGLGAVALRLGAADRFASALAGAGPDRSEGEGC